jgi:Flp pilus assembly pilin Flp
MIEYLHVRLASNWRAMRNRPDRGAVETTDLIMWIAVTVVVIGGLGFAFKGAVTGFFNSIVAALHM